MKKPAVNFSQPAPDTPCSGASSEQGLHRHAKGSVQ